MIVRIIKSYRDIVAICDSEILGKFFEEGKFQLDIKESFYGKEEKTEKEVIKIIQEMKREDATFSIVGEKSIETAIKAGIIDSNSVGKIQGVPFALILL